MMPVLSHCIGPPGVRAALLRSEAEFLVPFYRLAASGPAGGLFLWAQRPASTASGRSNRIHVARCTIAIEAGLETKRFLLSIAALTCGKWRRNQPSDARPAAIRTALVWADSTGLAAVMSSTAVTVAVYQLGQQSSKLVYEPLSDCSRWRAFASPNAAGLDLFGIRARSLAPSARLEPIPKRV